MVRFVLAFVLGAFLHISCKKEVKKGSSLGAPPLEPPVTKAMPSGLGGGTSLALAGDASACTLFYNGSCARENMIAIVKERIFEGREGCLGDSSDDIVGRVRCYLDVADSRMAELENRSQEVGRKCVKETLKDFSITMPVKGSVTHKYNCSEAMTDEATGDTSLYVGFGLDGDDFYLREIYTRGRMTYATTNKATEETEAWVVDSRTISSSATSDGSETVPGETTNDGKKAITVTQIIAQPASNLFEIAVAANHRMGSGVGCGIQLKSDQTYIYVRGIIGEGDEALGIATNCEAIETSATRYLEACLDASSLEEIDLSNCSSINTFSVSALRPAEIPEDLFDRMTDISFVSEVTGFNVEDPDAVEEESAI